MSAIETYRQHIETLCVEHHIVLEVRPGGGRAWRRSRRVRVPPIRTGISYAIALHEIGHILGENQDGRRLEKEVGAWLWARSNALSWRKPMKNAMKRRLASYLAWCRRRRGAWIPPASHIAWKLVG